MLKEPAVLPGVLHSCLGNANPQAFPCRLAHCSEVPAQTCHLVQKPPEREETQTLGAIDLITHAVECHHAWHQSLDRAVSCSVPGGTWPKSLPSCVRLLEQRDLHPADARRVQIDVGPPLGVCVPGERVREAKVVPVLVIHDVVVQEVPAPVQDRPPFVDLDPWFTRAAPPVCPRSARKHSIQ